MSITPIYPTLGSGSGGVANSNVAEYNSTPITVTDGDRTPLQTDVNGRQISSAYNDSTGANQSELINPVEYVNFGPVLLLDAVTATGASTSQQPSFFKYHTLQFVATGVSTGATIVTQVSYNGTDWVTIDTQSIEATGNTILEIVGKYEYIRVNLTSYSDGAYTVSYNAGN